MAPIASFNCDVHLRQLLIKANGTNDVIAVNGTNATNESPRSLHRDHQWIGNVSIGPIEVIDAIGIMEDVWKTSSLNGAIGANDATGTIVAIGTIFVIGIIIAIGTIV